MTAGTRVALMGMILKSRHCSRSVRRLDLESLIRLDGGGSRLFTPSPRPPSTNLTAQRGFPMPDWSTRLRFTPRRTRTTSDRGPI